MNHRSRNILKNQKGMTLVELVLAMAILLIVLAVAATLLLLGKRVFNKGLNQYDLQSSVRLASDFIVDEVRNASEITLNTPGSPDTYNQIYLSNKKLMYKPAGGTAQSKSPAMFENTGDLSFSIIQSGTSFMLQLTINASEKDDSYSATTKVLLNNIKSASLSANKTTIYFK